MNETYETIKQWSEETFPDATLEGQIEKFIDETAEVRNVENEAEIIFEIADCHIVACGLGRFGDKFYNFFSDLVHDLMFVHSIYQSDLDEAVQEKMKINRARKWNKLDGQYQHKD